MQSGVTIITPLISEITDPLCKESAILSYLHKLRRDGIEFYENVKKTSFNMVFSGELSFEQGNYITILLESVKDNLMSGDWVTALYALQNTPTDGVFSQQLKDNWVNALNEYITNNYQSW